MDLRAVLTLLQSVAALSDGEACAVVARWIHVVYGPGARVTVGREYTAAGVSGVYVASLTNAQGSGPCAQGNTERQALVALALYLGEWLR